MSMGLEMTQDRTPGWNSIWEGWENLVYVVCDEREDMEDGGWSLRLMICGRKGEVGSSIRVYVSQGRIGCVCRVGVAVEVKEGGVECLMDRMEFIIWEGQGSCPLSKRFGRRFD